MITRSSHIFKLTIAATIIFGLNHLCGAQDAASTSETSQPLTNAPADDANSPKTETKESLLSQGLQPDGKLIVQTAHTASERKIFEALDVILGVEFPGNPLKDVIDFIGSQHEIPIVIDQQQLEAIKLSDDLEVNLVLSGVTLRDSLNLLLKPHGLGFVVQNGALIITSQESAHIYTETRVYNIRALNVTNPQALADVLVSTTGVKNWVQSGGNGNISYFNGSIVVQQNQATHRQIEAVLNQLLSDVQNSKYSPDWSSKMKTNQSGQGFF